MNRSIQPTTKRLPENLSALLASPTSKKETPASMLTSSSPSRIKKITFRPFRRYRQKWKKSRRNHPLPSRETNHIRSPSKPISTLRLFIISRNISLSASSMALSSRKRTRQSMIIVPLLPNYGKLLKIQMFPPKRFCTIFLARKTNTLSLILALKNTASSKFMRPTTPKQCAKLAFTSKTRPSDRYRRANLRSILTVKS